MSRVRENLLRGGVFDSKRDRRGKLRSVRRIRGIDSSVFLNKGLWNLAEQITDGKALGKSASITLSV